MCLLFLNRDPEENQPLYLAAHRRRLKMLVPTGQDKLLLPCSCRQRTKKRYFCQKLSKHEKGDLGVWLYIVVTPPSFGAFNRRIAFFQKKNNVSGTEFWNAYQVNMVDLADFLSHSIPFYDKIYIQMAHKKVVELFWGTKMLYKC